jgi:hypothetical protein
LKPQDVAPVSVARRVRPVKVAAVEAAARQQVDDAAVRAEGREQRLQDAALQDAAHDEPEVAAGEQPELMCPTDQILRRSRRASHWDLCNRPCGQWRVE